MAGHRSMFSSTRTVSAFGLVFAEMVLRLLWTGGWLATSSRIDVSTDVCLMVCSYLDHTRTSWERFCSPLLAVCRVFRYLKSIPAGYWSEILKDKGSFRCGVISSAPSFD